MPETANISQGELFSETISIELRLFGTMQAACPDGGSFLPRNRKTRAVLAVLALADEKPVPRDLLINLLWASRGRAQAQASLRQSIHELRHHLAGLREVELRSDGDRLTLRGRALWVDALFIETRAFAAAQAAIMLRGPLLADLLGLSRHFDDWIEAEQNRISVALRPKLEAFLAASPDHPVVIQVAEAAIAFDPGFVAGWQALARSHLALGHSAAALDVHDRCIAAGRRSGRQMILDMVPERADAPEARLMAPGGDAAQPMPCAAIPAMRQPPIRPAFIMPSGTARLAMACMGAIGEASPDLAMSVGWHMLSALHRFENLSCAPLPRMSVMERPAQHLADEGYDFLVESFLERRAGADQVCVRLRDLLAGGEVFWSECLRVAPHPACPTEDEVAPVLAARIAAEIGRRRAILAEYGMEQDSGLSLLILRAASAVHALSRDTLAQAHRMLAEAISRDPRHPAPFAWQAYVQLLELGQGFVLAGESAQRCIGELIDRSLALRPRDASILSIAGHVLAFTQNRVDEGIGLQERALSANPHLPAAWMFSSLAHSYAGDHAEAIRRIRYAKLLSPSDPQAYFMDTALSVAHLMNGEPALAVRAARDAINLNPNFSSAFKIGLAASGADEAGGGDPKMLARLLQLEPALTVEQVVSRSPLQRSEDRQRLAEGLRLAGLPK